MARTRKSELYASVGVKRRTRARPPCAGTVFHSSYELPPQIDDHNKKSRPWLVAREELGVLIIVPRSLSYEGHRGIHTPRLPGCYDAAADYLPDKTQDICWENLEPSRFCDRQIAPGYLESICREYWHGLYLFRSAKRGRR